MGRASVTWCVAVLLGATVIAGCVASSNRANGKAVDVVEGTEAGTDTSYRLQIGDGIAVHSLSYPDLDDTATIGPDGHVALRSIGDFPIAGMTLSDASAVVGARYEAKFNHAGISLLIKNYALQQIFVSGSVNSPGVIRSSIPLTASGAIAQAGGMKLGSAHSGGALLLRRRPDGAVVYYKLAFNGDLPGSKGDPILRTNDFIYVPRTPIAAVADFVQANIIRIIPVNASYTVFHTY